MSKTQMLHFTVGEGINDIIRQAYNFEQRHSWAMQVLNSFEGLKPEHKALIINGKARLVPIEDGMMTLVIEDEPEYIEKLKKHRKWLMKTHVVVGNHYVDREHFSEYMNNIKKLYYWKRKISDKREGVADRVVSLIQELNNKYSESMYRDAGFKFRDGFPVLQPYEVEDFNRFVTDFKVLTEMEFDKWRKLYGEHPDDIKHKVLPLTQEDEAKAKDLHDELVLLAEHENSRPDLTFEKALLEVYDESIALFEKYRDGLVEGCYAMQLLSQKSLNRRILADTSDWQTLNLLRAGIHCLFDRTTRHGDVWKELEDT